MFYWYILNKLFVFSTQMQTNSSCFVKSYNIFSLNQANYTESVIFAIILVKFTQFPQIFYSSLQIFYPSLQIFYPSLQIFYSGQDCDSRGKFHVCPALPPPGEKKYKQKNFCGFYGTKSQKKVFETLKLKATVNTFGCFAFLTGEENQVKLQPSIF